MSDIEEDIKIIENYLNRSVYKEKDNNFFKGSGWEVVDLEIPQAMANILAERKQDKAKIKELEEALLKVKNKNVELFIHYKNSVPAQKVKDVLTEIQKEYNKVQEQFDCIWNKKVKMITIDINFKSFLQCNSN